MLIRVGAELVSQRSSELAGIAQVQDGAAPALQLLSLGRIFLFFLSGKELKPQGKLNSSVIRS